MKRIICTEDKIWVEMLNVLPKDNNCKDEEKLLLVNAVIFLLSKKKEFSLHLNWKQLETINCGDIGCKENININVNSLRRKFDRWLNNGVWANLLPILYDNREYRWITENGTYEVLLGCAKLVRDKNRYYKHYFEMVNEGHKNKEKDTETKFKKEIEELEQKLKKVQIEYDNQKRKADTIEEELTKKFNKERNELIATANKAKYDMKQLNRENKKNIKKLEEYEIYIDKLKTAQS